MPWELTQQIKSEVGNMDEWEEKVDPAGKPAGYLIEMSIVEKALKTYPIARSCFKYIIGRADVCGIVVDHVSVSNEHAEVEVEDGILWVVDKRSTNYTRIGNTMHTDASPSKGCKPGRAYQVHSKQFLTLGDVQLRYYNVPDYESLDLASPNPPDEIKQGRKESCSDNTEARNKSKSSFVINNDASTGVSRASKPNSLKPQSYESSKKPENKTIVPILPAHEDGASREGSISFTDDEEVVDMDMNGPPATLRYDPNEYNASPKKSYPPATLLYDPNMDNEFDIPQSKTMNLPATVVYNPNEGIESNNSELPESTQAFILSVAKTELCNKILLTQPFEPTVTSCNVMETQEFMPSLCENVEPSAKKEFVVEAPLAPTQLFDPTVLDGVDNKACPEKADGSITEEKVFKRDSDLSNSALMSEKVSAMGPQKELLVIPKEGSPESSPEFGERVATAERSTCMIPREFKNVDQVASDEDDTTCDEQEKVEKDVSCVKVLEQVEKSGNGLESRQVEGRNKQDVLSTEHVKPEPVPTQQREKNNHKVVIEGTEKSAQSGGLPNIVKAYEPHLNKSEEEIKQVKAKIVEIKIDEKSIPGSTAETGKRSEIQGIKGIESKLISCVAQVHDSPCTVLVSQPSLTVTQLSGREVLPGKLDFSCQFEIEQGLETSSEKNRLANKDKDKRDAEPKKKRKLSVEVIAKVDLSKSKSRKVEQNEDDESKLSEKKSIVKVLERAPDEDLSAPLRKQKEIKCVIKKDSRKLAAEPNVIKKRKLVLRKKSLTVPSKKRKPSLVEPVKTALRRSSRKSSRRSVYLLRTGYTNIEENKELRKMGAVVQRSVSPKLTHLCVDKFRTTEKVLCGLAYCDYLVSAMWPTACVRCDNFNIDETEYFIRPDANSRKAERELGFKLAEVIEKRKRRTTKIFNGLKLFQTKKVNPAFQNMFLAHGGKLVKSAGRKPRKELIILGLEDSDKQAQTLLKKEHKVRTQTWVKAAIFRQELPKASEFLLKRS